MVGSPKTNATRDWPSRRVVLLGASNLTLGLATVIESAQSAWGYPLDVLAADGHGRSYGMYSLVLCRGLPGIVQCKLWDALVERPPAPTAALVTDIGNDLLYEAPVLKVIGWAERCLDRLEAVESTIVVTGLPLEALAGLPSWRFRLLRRIFFPFNTLPQSVLLRRAEELNQRLIELQASRGFRFIQPPGAWYGFDPIHLRPVRWRRAWQTILEPWSAGGAMTTPALCATLWMRARLWSAAPAYRRVLGHDRFRAQPSMRLPDGTTLSFY